MAQWKVDLSKEQEEKLQGDIAVIVFRVGNEWYALPTTVIKEIASNRFIHRIPRNDNPNLLGIVNIGGEINIGYSIANILNIKAIDDYAESIKQYGLSRLLVVEIASNLYVFPVDEVKGIARYYQGELIKVPSTLEEELAGLLVGLRQDGEHQVAIIDEIELRNRIERMTA
jgi:chemotaxis-related protein WspD